MPDTPGGRNPAVRLCREAAQAYGSRLIETPDFCVLLANTSGAANITVAYDDGAATLWLDQYTWSEYAWTAEDLSEVDDLAETITAVQRGDAELHFRRRGRLLLHQGGRVGNRTIVREPAAGEPLILRLAPWTRQGAHP